MTITDDSGEVLHCGCYFDAAHDCGQYLPSGASAPYEPEDEGDYYDRMAEMDDYEE